MNYEKYFFEAIKLAELVKGNTSPNPAVGCVIVKNDKIISVGATQRAGCDHAEVVALKKAGSSAKGASLFVTLEPCVEYPGKRTPSCAKQIIESGISEVFIGMKDPNPQVNGRGIRQLTNAGIKVTMVESHKKEIQSLNEDFFKFIQTKIPYIYAKAAMTLDGNIATDSGDSQWISGEKSRHWVHQLRNRVDGIMVGVGTVIKDNPRLNVRIPERIKDPLRIIIDPNGRTPKDSFVMKDEGKTIFIVKQGCPGAFKELCIQNNKEFLETELLDNRICLNDLIQNLGKDKGLESILLEGGGKLFYQALQDNIIDKILLFIAPKIIGGRGIPLFNGKTLLNMSEAIKINSVSVENIGEDILIQGYIDGRNAQP